MLWDPVYALVKKIPRGKVLTYGALAKATRLPGGARAAGRAMAASPRGRAIPWHRVVGAGGKLSDSRALCLAAKEAPGHRGSKTHRVSRRPEKLRLASPRHAPSETKITR